MHANSLIRRGPNEKGGTARWPALRRRATRSLSLSSAKRRIGALTTSPCAGRWMSIREVACAARFLADPSLSSG